MSVRCMLEYSNLNMAVSKKNLNYIAAAILSVLGSTELKAEDELVMFELVAQPKVENFIDIIHKFNDTILYIYLYCTLLDTGTGINKFTWL